MSDVLTGVQSFLASNSTEVVILKFSHFYDASADNFFVGKNSLATTAKQSRITQLVNLIQPYSSSCIFTNNTTSRLTDIELNIMKGKVIIVFDIAELKGVSIGQSNIYSYLDFDPQLSQTADLIAFDRYSNTNDVNFMISASLPTNAKFPGQVYALEQPIYHGADLFLLSWTLTLQGSQTVNPASYNIIQQSQLANGILANNVVSLSENGNINGTCFPNIIYVDACDGFVTDVCCWINGRNIK